MTDREIKRLRANGLIEDAYRNLVSSMVAERYSLSEENAIMRKALANLPGAMEEFDEYNSFVEQCKITAKNRLGIL